MAERIDLERRGDALCAKISSLIDPTDKVDLDVLVEDYYTQWTTDDLIVLPNEDDMSLPAMDPPEFFYELNAIEGLPGADYLADRGVSLATAMACDVRYCPHYKALIFPIKVHGKWVGYEKRNAQRMLRPIEYVLDILSEGDIVFEPDGRFYYVMGDVESVDIRSVRARLLDPTNEHLKQLYPRTE